MLALGAQEGLLGQVVGLAMLAVLIGSVVALAALTTWWVLFALVPLVMMGGCMAMMGAMAREVGDDARDWSWGCCGMSPGNRAAE